MLSPGVLYLFYGFPFLLDHCNFLQGNGREFGHPGKSLKASIENYISFTELINYLFLSRPRTGLDKESLEWLEKMFRETVGDQKEIRREDFNKILQTKNVSRKMILIKKLRVL